MRLLHDCPHNWINKINKVPQPENKYFELGSAAHRIMQDHLSGKVPNEAFSHIKAKFPIVEEVDFDDRLRFEVPYKEYLIMGFIDGLDRPMEENPEVMLEGKFSSSPWSLQQYKSSPQRKIYGWALRSLKHAILVTGKLNPDEWKLNRIKTAKVPFVEQDYIDAESYIDYAIQVLKDGAFTTDLVNGRCTDPRCYYGSNCMFK